MRSLLLALIALTLFTHSQMAAAANLCHLSLSTPSTSEAQLTPRDRDSGQFITAVTPIWKITTNGTKERLIVPKAQVAQLMSTEGAPPSSLEEIFGYNAADAQAKAVFQFIAKLETNSQVALASAFEQLAIELMKQSEGGWQAFRFFGSDGSVGYRGSKDYALVFTPNGQIHKGYVKESEISPTNTWQADYSQFRRVK